MRTVAELAERHAGTTTVPTDPEALAEFFTFTDFGHFIEVYLSVVDLLRTPEDLWTLTYDVARDLAAQNVRYVELTCTPYTSIAVGISAEAYCEALEDARRRAEADFGITMRWIFDIPGESGCPVGRRHARHRTAAAARRARRASASAARRSACRAAVRTRTSSRRSPPGCTASRTPVSRPGPRRSGTRSTTSAPSASATASPRRRTRR